MTVSLARWQSILRTTTARGFAAPPFRDLVLGPIVLLDLDGHDPAEEMHDETDAEFVRRALEQQES